MLSPSRLLAALAATCCLSGGIALAQDEAFPEGAEGELYYTARIDLIDAGALEVELDGELDDEAWDRAPFQTWSHAMGAERGDALPPDLEAVTPEADAHMEWAAVADEEFLYVAFRVNDDAVQDMETTQCDVWRDDSVELYMDMLNDGPNCFDGANNCYNEDDAQLTVGLENAGLGLPEDLFFGGNAGGPACDQAGPTPEIMTGIVTQMLDDDAVYIGWQAELAISLETLGNLDDGTPTWAVEPAHGTVIGWNMHLNDDDLGGDRDHKLIWSLAEEVETAWRNPSSFGKMMFVDPDEEPPCLTNPVSGIACTREEDGTVVVTWTNSQTTCEVTDINIFVDGEMVATVDEGAESIELTDEQVPRNGQDHVIGVANASEVQVTCTLPESGFDDCGGLRYWNLLGTYDSPGCCPTAEQIAADYMTDGEIGELDFEWAPGATIDTDLGGAAASTILYNGAAGRNPGNVPTVFEYRSTNSRVDFTTALGWGEVIEDSMVYAQTYVIALEPIEAFIAVTSDDSIHVILNGEEVMNRSVGRGGSEICTPQDVTLDLVELQEGVNSIIVKVFNGVQGTNFALRFQDELGEAIVDDMIVVTSPCERPDLNPACESGTQFKRGDADANGQLELTDAVFTLLWLFSGGTQPTCLDAADADNNGAVELTDGVYSLLYLFSGGSAPPAPGPDDCGEDPAEGGSLGCDAYDAC